MENINYSINTVFEKDSDLVKIMVSPDRYLFEAQYKINLNKAVLEVSEDPEVCKRMYLQNPGYFERKALTITEKDWVIEYEDDILAALGKRRPISHRPNIISDYGLKPEEEKCFVLETMCFPEVILKGYESVKYADFKDVKDSVIMFMDKLTEYSEVKCEGAFFEEYYKRNYKMIQDNLVKKGFTIDDYVRAAGITKNEFIKSVKQDSEKQFRMEMTLDQIGFEKGIKVNTQERYDYLKMVADNHKISIDELLKKIPDETVYDNEIIRNKTLELLIGM